MEGRRETVAFPGEESTPATADHTLQFRESASTSRKAGSQRGAARGARGVVRQGGDVGGFVSDEAAALLPGSSYHRGLHPAHQVRGHLRDHSIPSARLHNGEEAGNGRVEPTDRPAEPAEPPAPHLRVPATAGRCSPQRLAKGPFQTDFLLLSRPAKLFCPLKETLCKGEKKEKKKGGERRKSFPFLAPRRRQILVAPFQPQLAE